MPLTPDQERSLRGVATALAATDPGLARALTTMSAPAPASASAVSLGRIRTLGLIVMLDALVVGLVPLGLGFGLGSAWLAGLGAVTACTLPIVALRVLARVLTRPR